MRLITISAFSLLLGCATSKEVMKSNAASSTVQAVTTVSTRPVIINADQAEVSKDIQYLASDELGGRGTGSEGIEKAAIYISEIFAESEVSTVPGMQQYGQSVPLVQQQGPKSASFNVADKTFLLGDDLLVLDQVAFDQSGSLRFLGETSLEEIATMNLTGAIVVTMAGSKEEGDPRLFYQLALEKQKAVSAQGGVALIELYRSPRAPFSQVSRFFGGSGLKIDESSVGAIPLLWLNDPKGSNLQLMDESAGTAAKLSLKPGLRKVIPAKNLLGFVAGTEPNLRDEVIVVSAHYDHLGIDGSRGGVDSIFNGARDNGLGTAALLGVARHFGENPGKRPVLLAAWTAEEKGLLGSKYYIKSPALPLSSVVFNLNFDGAGYDDTSAVTINGYGRTTAQPDIDEAISALGINPNPDPVPKMNLYQYSDNWSFAKSGIPAMNLAPGFTGFSTELMQYYHQAGDHSSSLDYAYVTRYVSAAIAATKALVNKAEKPTWIEGDALAPVAAPASKN